MGSGGSGVRHDREGLGGALGRKYEGSTKGMGYMMNEMNPGGQSQKRHNKRGQSSQVGVGHRKQVTRLEVRVITRPSMNTIVQLQRTEFLGQLAAKTVTTET